MSTEVCLECDGVPVRQTGDPELFVCPECGYSYRRAVIGVHAVNATHQREETTK